ncbi:MAG: hypothetical protein ACOCVS_03050 [Planctomycetota bacterium]
MIRSATLGVCLALLATACTGRPQRKPVESWVRARLANEIAAAFNAWAKNTRITFTFAAAAPRSVAPGEDLDIPVTARVGSTVLSDSTIRMRWNPEHQAWVGYYALTYADAVHGRFERQYEASYGLVYGERPRLVPGARPPAEPAEKGPPATTGQSDKEHADGPDGIRPPHSAP